MADPRVVIIGGGITGLTCAYRLRQARPDLDITVVEGTAKTGGPIETVVMGETNQYTLEQGPDNFITNKPFVLDLAKSLNLTERIVKIRPEGTGALVLSDGQLQNVPGGFSLLAPSRLLPFATSPILSPLGKLRALLELVIPPRKSDADESLASFVRRRLGPEILAKLAQPMVAGIYVGDAEKLSAQAVAERFVDLEHTSGSIIRGLMKGSDQSSGARYGLFASFDRGMSVLVDALVQNTSNLKLKLNTKVDSIIPSESGYRLKCATGEVLESDYLVLAIPAPNAARLLQTIDSALSSSLGMIKSASSVVVNAIFDRAALSKLKAGQERAYGAVIPDCERKKYGLTLIAFSFLSNKYNGRAPQDKVILRSFMGGVGEESLLDFSDEELKQKTLKDLDFLLGIKAPPEIVKISRWPGSMPQYNVGYKKLVAQIEQLAEKHKNLFIAGASYGGVGIPDCVNSGNLCAQKLISRV